MELTPAYSRDYKNVSEVTAAFHGGLNFILNDMSSPWDGKPFNVENARELGLSHVRIRYGQLKKVAGVRVPYTENID